MPYHMKKKEDVMKTEKLIKFDIHTSRMGVRELDCSIMASSRKEAAAKWYAQTPEDSHCIIIISVSTEE